MHAKHIRVDFCEYNYSHRLHATETMALILVPSDKPVVQMDDVGQAMVRAQTLLQKNMPTDPDAHEERFRFFTEAATKAPFLVLDDSYSDKQTWKDQKMCVKDALKIVLPAVIWAAVEGKMPAIQGIIDGSAKIKGFTSFWWSRESGSKHVAQFCINRIPNWGESRFEVYFVDITATFSSTAVCGISSTSTYMEARFNYLQYTTNTAKLLQEIRTTDVDQVRNEMEEWERANKVIC